jgi:DNA replicative helicase MCM subunit Mcm2 (Cdc46/Mcm family)
LHKKINELLEEYSTKNRINEYIQEKKLENVNDKIEVIVHILELIREFIKTPGTDMIRSVFNTEKDLIKELDKHIHKLSKEDFSKIEDLIILFAPTSDLQEISIDNGWGEIFLIISEKFDFAIKNLIEEFNLNPIFK